MNKKIAWVAGISAGVGGGLGSVSGSSSLIVVVAVGVVSALLISWSISGMLK